MLFDASILGYLETGGGVTSVQRYLAYRPPVCEFNSNTGRPFGRYVSNGRYVRQPFYKAGQFVFHIPAVYVYAYQLIKINFSVGE